jgi:cell division septal protein FtsQ
VLSRNCSTSTASSFAERAFGRRRQALVETCAASTSSTSISRRQRRVLESPWVASVTLWRLLPSTVEVSIVERVPVIVARLGDTLYLLDRAGVVVDEFKPTTDLNLPIVDGCSLRRGRNWRGPGTTAAGSAARGRARLRPTSGGECRIDVSTKPTPSCCSTTGGAAALATPSSTRLDRYLELGPTLAETFEAIDYVDLRFDRLFVRAEGRRTAEPVGRRP